MGVKVWVHCSHTWEFGGNIMGIVTKCVQKKWIEFIFIFPHKVYIVTPPSPINILLAGKEKRYKTHIFSMLKER